MIQPAIPSLVSEEAGCAFPSSFSFLQHVDASTLLEEEVASSKDLKKAKLDAIDRLLWGTKSKRALAAAKPEGKLQFNNSQ